MRLLLAASIVALMSVPAVSSDIATIASSTYLLKRDGNGVCSGTFIRSNDVEDLFLTAAHCVEASLLSSETLFSVSELIFDDKMKIVGETKFFLDVARVDRKNDTAILKVRSPETVEFTTVDVATVEESSTLQVGAPVIASGFPLGDFYSLTDGYFLGKALIDMDPIRDHIFYRTSVSVTQGSSGGGLYANFGGTWKVIGSSTAVDPRIDFRSMFSTSESTNAIIAAPDDIGAEVNINEVFEIFKGAKN